MDKPPENTSAHLSETSRRRFLKTYSALTALAMTCQSLPVMGFQIRQHVGDSTMANEIEARYERGYDVLRKMFDDKFAETYRKRVEAGGFGSRAGRMALEFAFAENWAAEEGLNRKERSIAVISALIAQGREDELKNHYRAGFNNGLTVEEVESLILQLIPYCGFPAGAQAMEAAAAVLKEKGMDVTTSKDSGLL